MDEHLKKKSDLSYLSAAIAGADRELPPRLRGCVKIVLEVNNHEVYKLVRQASEHEAFDHGVADADFPKVIPVWNHEIRKVPESNCREWPPRLPDPMPSSNVRLASLAFVGIVAIVALTFTGVTLWIR